MTVGDDKSYIPCPRLCHITKWPDFDGYGFNLHAEKNKPGQYIGKVDPSSPADAAGLKEGDKIIEVNLVNISQENHKQVVQRIKADPNQTRLLVVDSAAENYHKEHGVVITGQLSYIQYLSSDKHFEHIDTRIQEVKSGRESPVSDSSSVHREEVHAAVGREDSLESQRTLSTRSSVSSNGKEKHKESPDHEDTIGGSEQQDHEHEDQDEEQTPKPVGDKIQDEIGYIDDTSLSSEAEDKKPPEEQHNKAEEGEEADPPEPCASTRITLASLEEEATSSCSSSEEEGEEPGKIEELSFKENLAAQDTAGKGPNSLSSGSPRSTPSPVHPEVEVVRGAKADNLFREAGLDLPLTAKEMRERISSRRKKDPRREERIDFRKKYEIIQTL